MLTNPVASIAVAIAVFVLAVLDMIDADAPHEVEGVARDVDVRLIIGLDVNKRQGSRFLTDRERIAERNVIEPLHE